ncbi:hypothetical protein THRCLA_22204 [Thraustotheca clavata]|uniref:PX domain-containing protein n=1 Tax=Thraustotheca clavata TaxID=74557 RepID=A0A1V9ZAJ2_9STRA|nr:hypothetical protein THRCLA_22204 [Thraustotheca clavata]
MGVYLKMKGMLASVTSCIGGVQERYVVCVRSQQAGLWYVYKLHADFVALYDDLHALASSAACAQECWLAPLLVGLKGCLDPVAGEKLLCLNTFLQKLTSVQTLQSSEMHADVCLLRPKIDAKIKEFLEWKHESRVGVKRRSCESLPTPSSTSGMLRRTQFSIIQPQVVLPSLESPTSKVRRLYDNERPARRRVYTEVNFDGL